MELGLLYEFDVPQPWAGEHPWGQRNAERQVYSDCIEQIVLADKKGFDTAWLVEHHFRENRSHMPCNEVVLGALSQITENIRLGFGVTLMPHEFIHPARVAEKVATVDLLSRGRVRMGHGPLDADGADRLRCRSRAQQGEDAGRRHAPSSACGSRNTTRSTRSISTSPRGWSRPSPISIRIRPSGWRRRREASARDGRRERAAGLLCFSIMQPLDKLKPVIDAYREAQQRAKPLTSVHTNKVGIYTLVHCAESRADFETNRLWDSMWWWYKGIAEFTLKWELAHLPPEQQRQAFPLLEARAAASSTSRSSTARTW